MITCQNCTRTYSCSCQSRTASNGKRCCSICLPQAEQQAAHEREILRIQQQQNLEKPNE